MTNQVFTYVNALGEDSSRVQALLAVWERAWAAAGFDPLVVTERAYLEGTDADLHAATTRTYPTVNPRQYEDASWERWSAFRHVCPPEGALFCDFDVMPVTWRAEDLVVPPDAPEGITQLHEGVMPCLLALTPAGVDKMQALFTAPEFAGLRFPITWNGRPHLSDLFVFSRWAPGALDLTHPRVCELFRGVYPNPPAAVHFANMACESAGFPDRAAAIQAFSRGHGLGSVWGPFAGLA